MRPLFVLAPALLVLATQTGCVFQNLSATERLADSVNGLTDETRWGRADLAAERVVPAYRTRFTAIRARWGAQLQIADAEVQRMSLLEDGDAAVSVVSVSWYELTQMDLHASVIEQRWKRSGQHFTLMSERVVAGDAAILEVPATPGAAAPSDSHGTPPGADEQTPRVSAAL